MMNYEVTKEFGEIGNKKDRSGRKGTLKLRKVRWQGSHPMYDLRNWDEEDKPMRGMSFNAEQLRNLRDLLNGMEIGDEDNG